MDEYCGCEFEETTLTKALNSAQLAIVFSAVYRDDEALRMAYSWMEKAHNLAEDPDDQKALKEIRAIPIPLDPLNIVRKLGEIKDKEHKRIMKAFKECMLQCAKGKGE